MSEMNGSVEALTPSTARRDLGKELARTRRRVNVSLQAAAASIERSAPTLSRLETGQSVPRLVDVRALLDFYRSRREGSVTDAAERRIVALAERARAQEWFASYSDVLSGELTSAEAKFLVEFEGAASTIRAYENDFIHGLVQTPEYATEITDACFPHRSPEDRERLVEFRMHRQQIFNGDDPATFNLILNEAAVRRVVGGPDVMHAQIEVLLGEIRGGRPNVTVQVVPITVAVPAMMGGSFAQMDLRGDETGVVYLEGRASAQFVREVGSSERYRQSFAQLSAATLPDDKAVDLLEGVAKSLA